MLVNGAVIDANEIRTPQCGEILMLADGRRFVITSTEAGLRGWWFTAQAQDGSRTLQGNLLLTWDAHGGVWRPAGMRAASVPRSMGQAPQRQPRASQRE